MMECPRFPFRQYAAHGRHTRGDMKTRIWMNVIARLFVVLACLPVSASATETLKPCDSNVERLLGCISQVWKEWPSTTLETIETLFSTSFAKTPISSLPSSSYFVLAAQSANFYIRAVHSSSDAAELPKLKGLVVEV